MLSLRPGLRARAALFALTAAVAVVLAVVDARLRYDVLQGMAALSGRAGP